MALSDKTTSRNAPKQCVVKVKSAALTRNFERLGRSMDPFAQVEFSTTSGDKVLVSRTHTEWNAHKSPRWDHACRGHPYRGKGSGDSVEISVWEEGNVRKSRFMGVARVLVDDLLADEADHVLDLVWEKGEITGTVTIQALLVGPKKPDSGGTDDGEVTCVDPDMFVRPVKRLGVSGGTAPFFELTLSNPKGGNSASHYIGKDLSRAVDEIVFYEEILALKNEDDDPNGLKPLLNFAFEYAGVLKAPEAGVADTEPERELLVLRNLRDGCETLRLLDLKMGQKTASANWQGKSRRRALKQSTFDKSTNSFVEGYRLEGFDGCPDALASMDPLMDMENQNNEKAQKKAMRLMLQNMTGSEVFMHFLDLHQGKTADSDVDLTTTFSAAELGEIVMHEIVRRLTRLAVACEVVTVPQKWVGSSVALGYDSGVLPARSSGEAMIRDTVLVNIFDWGRSELNTVAKEHDLSTEEQQSRKKFWRYYKGGIEHLAWVAAQMYLHRFGNGGDWKEVTLAVYDFDAMTKDDYLGQIIVPVRDTPPTECILEGLKGGPVSTLSYSIQWRACPVGSRLKGSWRVSIQKAQNLPNKDSVTLSDPYCMITAVSADGKFRFDQVTSVVPNDLNPVWGETLDIPVAALPDELEKALEEEKTGLGGGDVHAMFSRVEESNPSLLVSAARSLTSSHRFSSKNPSAEVSEWAGRLQDK